jgi:pimeloyl-ACP methyl ester carboxylesterase
MHVTAEQTANGIREREFRAGEISGVLWTPAGAGPRPLILMGHGGGSHKKSPGQRARAHHFVTACGFAVAAIDAPGHGERPRTADDERRLAVVQERIDAGEPFREELARANAERAAIAVPEWQAVLDALPEGPVGYYGVSLGTAIGIPLSAAEPRITAAVLGLAGHAGLAETAKRITIPVEFVLQWDDELIPREESLALFDAFASADKTLHANPGGHLAVPALELESAARFFTRHLG